MKNYNVYYSGGSKITTVKASCVIKACKAFMEQFNKPYKIEKYGYDPKQLHHILRLNEFISRLYKGEDFKDCLISKDIEFLSEVKMGVFDLETAKNFDCRTAAANEVTKDDLPGNEFPDAKRAKTSHF